MWSNLLYVSNLAAGLENALDDPKFLLDAIAPFNGSVGLELFLHYNSESYKAHMESIAEWLGDIPRAMHGPFRQVEATSEAGSDGQKYLFDAYRWGFEQAKKLGVKEMVFHTHQRVILPHEKESAQKCCMDNLNQLTTMGRLYGVTLLVENLGIQLEGVSLFDEQEFIELIEQTPQVECLIDTGHLNVAGWDTEHVLQKLSKRIKGYHLHNNDGILDSHQPIQAGTYDYDRFFALYKKYTPNVPLTLEYADGIAVTPSLLVRDLEWTLHMLCK